MISGFQSRFLNWPSSTETDRRLFACWIDLGIPFGGSYPEATEWTDKERAIYDHEQDKRMKLAEAELKSRLIDS